ncbi:uncharacterized protein LOC117506112, partial [Thalassophryne amazonica]|uniref:uncharacterized protein LOC117506112 n=1 Tax=Thalassophryne amazonica TaxID=390379 RepID=UPI0014709CC4
MDFVQSTEEFSPLPLHGDVSQSAEQTSTNQQGVESHFNATQDQSQTRRTKNHMELQLEFQDSNLSPALSLLPVNSGVAHFTECSVFQQSDANFAPLRPCTDISAASEKLHFPPKNRESQASEYGSLSQYPLIQESAFSEEGVSSCPSLFPHSVSPEEDERQLAMASSPLSSAVDDRQGMQSGGGTGSIETDKKTITASSHKQVGEVSEGGIVLVSRDSTAQHQKDLGVLSSSSAVSSASETALKRTKCLKGRVEGTMLGKPGADKITVTHEHPAGEASLPQQQTQNLSQMPSCEVSNINMGSRSTQPDDCSESLHRELLLESQKSNRSEAQPRSQPQEGPTTSEASLTPCPPSMSEVKLSRTRTNLREAVLTGLFSAGIEQDQREQEVWSLRNQTGIEGSYINFLPQSQSTPGVSKPPRKSIVKPTSRQVSIVNSNMEDLSQSSTGRHPQSAVPVAEFCHNNIPDQCQEEVASAKVQSLPSLTYMQKVGAWQTNQRSGHLSLFDSLVLQGFSGISPKKKAYDAVSGPLNDILNQQARSLHQHPASDVNKNITKKSISESMLFSPRNETVGSVTKDKGDDESAARIFASSVGRDTSHSSLSTVVKSTQKAQQTQKSGERQSLVQDDVHQQMVATVKPLPFLSLGHISDVTLSSSQDSSRSGKKLGASIGSSSVISMEVHNYIPNWNTKVTTPPALTRPRELSIEERIPLYLYNRGVEQSMSTILTPFVPRGPIREPEFSLTDLSTVKGSVGTPAKSTQPSEVGSSHIEAFSRSSILSVETSISVSLSQDSIYPTVSIPEQISVSRSSSAAPNQNDQRLTPCTQPDDASPPVLQSDSSFINTQDTTQVGNNTEGNLVKLPSAPERDPDQSMHVSMQQKAKHSLVGTKELEDSHLTLSQKETCVPAGIPVSSPAASRLSSDNILLSWKKTDIQKDSSFISSSTDVGPTSPASMVRTSPSSDSILTSEKVTQPYTVHKRKQSSVQSNAIIPGVTVTYMKPQDSMISGSVWPMLTLSKSTWRTEPEGCSAVPPDNTIPTQLPLKPSAAIITQAASSPAEAGVPEEIEQITQTVPAESSSSSPTLADTEQGTNDGSSELSQTARVAARESPLSTRVAKLLQNDSPATTVSSMYIITDTEENTSKDWIKLKISRQQGDSLELDIEDRKRIEEIKRELLLKNTVKSQESTITDSGMSSTFRGLRKQESLLPIGTFNTVSGVNIQPSLQPLQFSMNLSDSRVQQYHPHYQDLASQVLEIAAREGIILARTDPRTFTSIGISTSKCSHSPTKSTIPLVKPDPKLLGTILDKEKSVGTAPITVSQLVNGYLNTIGDKYEGGHTLSSALDKEHMNVQEENIQSQQENHKLMIQDISVSGVGYGVQQATGVSTTETPASIGHISRVHLTLSPKATDQSVAADVQSSHATANPSLALSEFDKLRHWPSKASSPDKGVRLSIRPKLSESRDPEQTTGTERTETSVPFKTIVPKGGIISSSPQSFKLLRRTAVSPRPFISETPAIPILLPYKPTGSDELFYVPQTEADISSTDVTEESSHTGRAEMDTFQE